MLMRRQPIRDRLVERTNTLKPRRSTSRTGKHHAEQHAQQRSNAHRPSLHDEPFLTDEQRPATHEHVH